MNDQRAVEVVVRAGDDGGRLDAVLSRATGIPRARAAGLVAEGAVTVDGAVRQKSYRVSAGERITTVLEEVTEPARHAPEVHVVFEDEHLLVVDKPSGLVVHAAATVRKATLVDALLARGTPLAPRAGESRPGIVHRLDRDVSGLLVVAKTDEAHEALAGALARRRIRREYLALVQGGPEVDRGKIDAPIGRHPVQRTRMEVSPDGRPAVTHFAVLERLADATLLLVRLQTGRTHQIRVHLAAIGLPIIGDAIYGTPAGDDGPDRPFLHSTRLGFTHPVTGADHAFESALPADLERALADRREAA